jgi:Fe-S-cluster containining protein
MSKTSPLSNILMNPDFKPFSGPCAYRVLTKARAMLECVGVELSDTINSVSSLGMLDREDIQLMHKLQESMCLRCGECCRKNISMKITKTELKKIAEFQHVSYKKLKKIIGAKPNGDGTLTMRRNPCPFLKGVDCMVYPVRPLECKYYPLSHILPAMGQGELKITCPICDDLLAEIVVKRAIEEKQFKDTLSAEIVINSI